LKILRLFGEEDGRSIGWGVGVTTMKIGRLSEIQELAVLIADLQKDSSHEPLLIEQEGCMNTVIMSENEYLALQVLKEAFINELDESEIKLFAEMNLTEAIEPNRVKGRLKAASHSERG
jgi:hypothetical protein